MGRVGGESLEILHSSCLLQKTKEKQWNLSLKYMNMKKKINSGKNFFFNHRDWNRIILSIKLAGSVSMNSGVIKVAGPIVCSPENSFFLRILLLAIICWAMEPASCPQKWSVTAWLITELNTQKTTVRSKILVRLKFGHFWRLSDWFSAKKSKFSKKTWPKIILKISKNDQIEEVGPKFVNALYKIPSF